MTYIYRGTLTDRVRPTVQSPASNATPARHVTSGTDKCGTRAGYRQHQNRGTKPCDRCKGAQARYMKERRDKAAGRGR